ncbi:hypothetical protein E2C01_069025 [Portunus trituberculatus]|uniref:Uncharacterized protein n=1 Tax=Portunus trituberculatus TaxID=210409 RepID=A0A5B7I1Q1_PORTR|nr:hypothetical protein [Portunus trituberculatus]
MAPCGYLLLRSHVSAWVHFYADTQRFSVTFVYDVVLACLKELKPPGPRHHNCPQPNTGTLTGSSSTPSQPHPPREKTQEYDHVRLNEMAIKTLRRRVERGVESRPRPRHLRIGIAPLESTHGRPLTLRPTPPVRHPFHGPLQEANRNTIPALSCIHVHQANGVYSSLHSLIDRDFLFC